MSTPKTIQLAKSTLRGKDKEDIYPKTVDTAVAAKTIEGEDSTVDQVYLKEANLEGAVTSISSISDLINKEELNVITVQVTNDSTMSQGTIKADTFKLNGEPIFGKDVAVVNSLINMIKDNYNVVLKLYKEAQGDAEEVYGPSLTMTSYIDLSGTSHVTGFMFIDGKEVLLVENMRETLINAVWGTAEDIPYKAIPLYQLMVASKGLSVSDDNTVNLTSESLSPIYRVIPIDGQGNFLSSSESVNTLIELASDAGNNIPILFTHLNMIASSTNIDLWLEKFNVVNNSYTFTFSGIIKSTSSLRRIQAYIEQGQSKFTITYENFGSLVDNVSASDFESSVGYNAIRTAVEAGVNVELRLSYSGDTTTYILKPTLITPSAVAFEFSNTKPSQAPSGAVGYYLKTGDVYYAYTTIADID